MPARSDRITDVKLRAGQTVNSPEFPIDDDINAVTLVVDRAPLDTLLREDAAHFHIEVLYDGERDWRDWGGATFWGGVKIGRRGNVLAFSSTTKPLWPGKNRKVRARITAIQSGHYRFDLDQVTDAPVMIERKKSGG